MEYIEIQQKENGIAFLFFNRPEKKNAFNQALLEELHSALDRLAADAKVRLLIISGKGDAFSSGVDLKSLLLLKNVKQAKTFARLLENASEKIYRFPHPVIAVVNGLALGGGFGFATAADIRIVYAGATIGYPAVKLGAILPATCTVYLQALVGRGKAMDLLMTGKMLNGARAVEYGLGEYLIDDASELMPFAEQIAGQILEGGDEALALTKDTVNFASRLHLEQMKIYAADNFAYLSQTADWQERMQAFASRKRKK